MPCALKALFREVNFNLCTFCFWLVAQITSSNNKRAELEVAFCFSRSPVWVFKTTSYFLLEGSNEFVIIMQHVEARECKFAHIIPRSPRRWNEKET